MHLVTLRAHLLCLTLLAAGALAQPRAHRDQRVTEADIRAALRELRNGRVERPEFESLTDEQIRYLKGTLSGPRSAIAGPLVVMLASPELGDLAQRLMA